MQLQPMATPVKLMVEMIYEIPEGKGMISFSRDALWPGVPMQGQTLTQGEAPWPIAGPLPVREVDYEIDENGEITCAVVLKEWHLAKDLARQRAMQLLSESEDWRAKAVPERFFTKDGMMTIIQDMVDEGWKMDYPGRWFAAGGGPKEDIPVLVGDDENEDDAWEE